MRYVLALCILLLTACASTGQVQTAIPSGAPVATTTPLPITPMIEPCAYVEATQNLPDATSQVDQAIKQLQPNASGRAEAYGENCVYTGSGQSTFSAMETDFYITVNVKSLKDDNELGSWILSSMKIIKALPSDSIAGPQAGFVEFTFKTTNDQKKLRMPISQYNELPSDINASDVIPTLFSNP